MMLYSKLIAFRPLLDETIQRSRQLHESYTQAGREAFEQQLTLFTREELILTYVCSRIGLTAKGERIESVNGEQQSTRYPLPIRESAEELLIRYAGYYVYRSRSELIRRLSGYTSLAQELEDGLALLQELPAVSEASDEASGLEYSKLAQEPAFTEQPTQIVAMDYTDGEYDYFEVREDLAGEIGALRNRFDAWMAAQEGVQPFRVHQTHVYENEIVFEDWGNLTTHADFIDWIHTQVCREQVIRRLVGQPTREAVAHVSF